uniref:Cytochrome b5 heme-binding domain-containing protein n=1 Tax=Rhizophora mucronata TaxID=61149 RepID=A0A2P2JXW4_RHIMU
MPFCNVIVALLKSVMLFVVVLHQHLEHDIQVYDVTPFMDDHPGGDEVLLSATGKDATNDFEDVGHSDSARDMMAKYLIGEIDSSTIPAKRTYIPTQQATHKQDKTPESVIKMLQFLVPLLILGLAFAVRHFTKKE